MNNRLAAAVFILVAAVSASAGTITSLSPSAVDVSSGEHFLTVFGTNLGNRLVFDGPAGHFETNVTAVFSNRVVGWVPELVVQRAGSYSVTVTGDPSGTSGPATFTVRGFIFPLVLLMPEYVRAQPKSREGVEVTYQVLAVGGKDKEPVVSCDPKSGSFFKMGVTRVNCVATNIYGDRATGSFDVVVRDEDPPLFDIPREPIVVKADSIEGAKVEFSVKAFDEIWGDVQAECLPHSGSVFPIGVTNVLCTATDLDLNVGNVSFAIEVLGDVPFYEFEVIVPGPIFVDAKSPEGTPVEFEIGTKGTEDKEPRITCTHKSGQTFPVGTTVVTCDALDRWGMRGRGAFDVTVIDFSFPQILEFFSKPDSLIADNKIYPIDVFVEVVDDIDPRPVCEVYDVTSKEDINLDDNEDPKSYDWAITGPLSLELRAERFGTTRVYNVWLQCTDFYGNRTITRTPVSVSGGVAGKSTGVSTGGRRRSVR